MPRTTVVERLHHPMYSRNLGAMVQQTRVPLNGLVQSEGTTGSYLHLFALEGSRGVLPSAREVAAALLVRE